jgi:ADP-ribosyl-[dinitrogen reductase] hydrolase
MLLELAIGDAYGGGFEYASREMVATYNTLEGYVKRKQGDTVSWGRYTDDTQMSLAIAEAIVSGEAWTPENLAQRFVEVFHRDQRLGYAQRFYDFLKRVRSGQQFLDEIKPASDKSGAAMRAAPIGIFSTLEEVKEKTTIQARLTHDTPDGIAAAVAAALATHYCLYDLGPTNAVREFLDAEVPGYDWAEPWRADGHVGSKGWMSVRAAVTALATNDSLSSLLKACIAYTGDVDTVATVALAAASCSRAYRQDLPGVLIYRLENGTYGRDYITALDTRLMALRG